ncbi:3'-5' exonuclease [Wukongibacter sp. M2B1]|uniref:3'-5' exonuclease n=1 Tax=Wukongibacter sp. M2B1 TaxID=3088895 RepID=UPI003D7BF47C
MTVHQSKGLEWGKVIISLKPSRFDKYKFIDVFLNPYILDETSQNEFARLFFVACSLAKEELIIHLENQEDEVVLMKKVLEDYCMATIEKIFYEFLKD